VRKGGIKHVAAIQVELREKCFRSESAKDAPIARFKERVRALEEQVRSLQEENELLYGKLSERAFKPGEIPPAPP